MQIQHIHKRTCFLNWKKMYDSYLFLRKLGNHNTYTKLFLVLGSHFFSHLKSNISTAVVNALSFNVDMRSDKYLGSLSWRTKIHRPNHQLELPDVSQRHPSKLSGHLLTWHKVVFWFWHHVRMIAFGGTRNHSGNVMPLHLVSSNTCFFLDMTLTSFLMLPKSYL